MNKPSYLKYFLFAVTVLLFASCDSNYNELGADIIGADNFGFEKEAFPLTLTNQYIGAAESKNQSVNPLGIYDNPVFGLTKANFVTQVQLDVENPIFDPALAPEIYSVELYVPLFNTQTAAPASGVLATYTLDSIYGPKPYSKFKLSVYESKYFIRDINPIDQLSQPYYNDNSDFSGTNIGTELLNNSPNESQNNNFVFDEIEYVDIDSSRTATPVAGTLYNVVKRAPALKLNLKKQFFIDKILNAPAGKLLSNNVFKDYFRGLYFKVDQVAGEQGNLAMLNFAQGKIVVKYKELIVAGSTAEKLKKRLVINLTGNSISLIDQGTPPVIPNPSDIVLKGGANNSMAILDLFDPYNPNPLPEYHPKLTELRNRNILINDASLTFTIARGLNGMDQANSGGKAYEPIRLYLYDLNNKRAIADYTLDQTTGTTTKLGKTVYDGIIKRESGTEKRGLTYKIKITKHIMQLIAKDTTTNVRLGLVVTEDITNSANIRIKNPIGNIIPAGTLKVIPTMSAIHPLGTILCGSDDPDPAKRPKFEIYYTKPKQN